MSLLLTFVLLSPNMVKESIKKCIYEDYLSQI